jgi:hypothetical protein
MYYFPLLGGTVYLTICYESRSYHKIIIVNKEDEGNFCGDGNVCNIDHGPLFVNYRSIKWFKKNLSLVVLSGD